MKTLQDHVLNYLESIEKDPKELHEVRVVSAPAEPEDRVARELELVFKTEWVTYTRVARFYINGGGMQYKSITQKTRLHVPLNEVPEDAGFYIGSEGPYTKHSRPYGMVYCAHYSGLLAHNVVHFPTSHVECAFYYVKGVGAVAGGKVMATEADLLAKYGMEGLEEMVGGCKFDFWDACREISGGNGAGQ